MSKLLKTGNGNQHSNKAKAIQVFCSLNPDAEQISSAHVSLNGKTYHVAASSEQPHCMVSAVTPRHLKNLKDGNQPFWMEKAEVFVIVRQLKDGRIIIYEISDFGRLVEKMGMDGVPAACISWANLNLVKSAVTIIAAGDLD